MRSLVDGRHSEARKKRRYRGAGRSVAGHAPLAGPMIFRAVFSSRLAMAACRDCVERTPAHCSAAGRGLAAGCGWSVRTLTGCLVRGALAVDVPATRYGVCCLSFVESRVA
jgi:hypothetical protein